MNILCSFGLLVTVREYSTNVQMYIKLNITKGYIRRISVVTQFASSSDSRDSLERDFYSLLYSSSRCMKTGLLSVTPTLSCSSTCMKTGLLN